MLALLIDLAIFLPFVITPFIFFFDGSERFKSLVLNVGWLLYSMFEIFTAGTPGKKLLGMEIANADGSEADVWTLSQRWQTKQLPVHFGALFALTQYPLLYPLGGYDNLIVIVGCLYASTEFRQAWHDQWAQTAVFRCRRRPPARPAFNR